MLSSRLFSSFRGLGRVALAMLGLGLANLAPAATATGKFYVSGTQIIDPSGNVFIAKGTNIGGYQTNWNDAQYTFNDFNLVANVWKFNFIRLYIRINPWTTTNRQGLWDIIDKYISGNVVVMVTYHDHTGNAYTGTDLDNLKAFNVELVNRFKTHAKFTYLWFETMNEPGTQPLADIDTMNRDVCTAIRNAGATDNIFCAPGNNWAQEGTNGDSADVPESTSYILSKGQAFVAWNQSTWGNSNVIFSPHFYRIWVYGDAKMAHFIDAAYAKNLAIVAGEYGVYTNNDTTAATQSLINVGYARNIGRCVWHWQGGDQNDLTSAGPGRSITPADGSRPTNLTWLGGVAWDDNHAGSDIQSPTAPTVTVTGKTSTSISLSWTTSTDNVGVTGYEIFAGSVLEGTTTTATTFTITGLSANSTYSITVKARDAAGNRGTSTALSVTTNSATAITIANDATLGAGTNQFNFSGTWGTSTGAAKYNSDDHYSSTTGSYVTIAFNGTQIAYHGAKASHHGIASVSIDGGTAVNVDCYSSTRAEDALLWTSPTLAAGAHTLKIQVAGTKNASSTGYTISVDRVDVTNPDSTAPSAPTNLASTGTTSSSVSLSWTASTDNVGVTGYDVYQGTTKATTVTGTTATVTGLAASTAYTFKVYAFDAANNVSAASSSINVTTAAAPNRITNGDFETGSLTPWTGTNAFISGVFHAGAKSGRVGTSGGAGGTIQQTITGLSPNTSYTVRAWINMSATGSSATLGVDGYGSSATATAVTGTAWTQKTITFTTGASATSARVYMTVPANTGQLGYIDDVTVN